MVLDTGSSRLAALEKENSPLLLPSTPNRVSALEKENKAVEEVETVHSYSSEAKAWSDRKQVGAR
jgi:hypothetical protein